MSVERFTITYDHVGYRVSIPNYRGGEVVRAKDYDALRVAAVDALEHLAWGRPDTAADALRDVLNAHDSARSSTAEDHDAEVTRLLNALQRVAYDPDTDPRAHAKGVLKSYDPARPS